MFDSTKDIFKSLTYSEASTEVQTQAKYYPGFVRVYIANRPFKKLMPGFELQDKLEITSSVPTLETEDNLERSLRRTRKSIKDYVLCNKFNHFATFTFSKDRKDVDKCKTKMSNWLKNQRKRKGKFKYLIVPELHKDRQALHFHALLEGYKGEIKRSFTHKGKPIIQNSRAVYELPSYTLGFNNLKFIDDELTKTRIAFYIQKYITKDMPVFPNKNRYWISSGLKAPVVEDNPEPWYAVIKADREYENDFGKILEFDAGKNPIVDMFLEAKQK